MVKTNSLIFNAISCFIISVIVLYFELCEVIDMYDTIIIGAGPAGLYAGTLAGMHKLKACILESSFEYGGTLNLYKQKMVYDMPGYRKINAGDLINTLYDQYSEYKADVPLKLNTKAISIDYIDDHYVLETTQGVFETKTLLLANGGGTFEPRLIEVPDAASKSNIYYNVKDVHDFKDQELIVLGGGDSAVDWSLTLAEVAKKVTLIHRRHDFRAHEYSVLKIKSIGEVLTPYVPIGFVGYDKVEYLTIQNTEDQSSKDIKCDALFVFYGSSPAKHNLSEWGFELDDKGLIKVASSMETTRKGIFAVGNSVTYIGKKKMISTGLGEAATAISTIGAFLYPEKTQSYKH